jgi:NAD(P)-dependent dehydrogenase (short-subunit alcohol dehydrogenase family)
MHPDLANKIVLITGGSKGIGFACAKAFLSEGARVAICSRSAENVDRAKAQMPGVFGVAADLGDAAAAAAMIDAVEAALGPIDILVNSAGAAKRSAPKDLTPAAWRAAMDAKYFTAINVIDPLVKRMAERGTGVIVTLIGSGGKVASSPHLAGGAANAALMLATAGLGTTYAAQGVRVLGVSPGLTETDRVAQAMDIDARTNGITVEAARAAAVGRIPMGRLARPEEIANMVVFLASASASYVTGTTIAMDGGLNPVVV